MAYVTPPHLTRLFKTAFGMPPLRYIIQKKVQYAQGLLLTTDMTVRDIAREIGIDDVSYFIRVFKKTIGFTPQDYRNKLR
jgi:AraC-like DNA-binding protein